MRCRLFLRTRRRVHEDLLIEILRATEHKARIVGGKLIQEEAPEVGTAVLDLADALKHKTDMHVMGEVEGHDF